MIRLKTKMSFRHIFRFLLALMDGKPKPFIIHIFICQLPYNLSFYHSLPYPLLGSLKLHHTIRRGFYKMVREANFPWARKYTLDIAVPDVDLLLECSYQYGE